jgi:plasmid stabilization system protein ParE
MAKKYHLRYLSLFEQDLDSAVMYITYDLQNPAAANRLLDDVDTAIKKRLANPLGFKPYDSKRDRIHKYYRIPIRNYIVFYVVIDDVMEVRRFQYSKRNLIQLI